MSDIYHDRLRVNMPEYMDKSAKRLSLQEALDTVIEQSSPPSAEKVAELESIAVEEEMEWWLKRLIEEREIDGKDI